MSANQPSERTFGRLIADVANWAAVRALRQENVAFGENMRDPSPDVISALERGRQSLAEAEAELEAAITTLDSLIGVTPGELENIAAELRKLGSAT